MRFEWSERKRRQVLEERGVDFIDATEIFEDPVIVFEDRRRDYGEDRYVALGKTAKGYFYVVFTPRADAVRVISAWRGGRRARRRYQELYPGRAEGDA